MNFLTPEQEMWRTTVARFIDEEIGRDYIRKCDREREYPYEAYEKVAKQGWLGILFSEESGGLGGTHRWGRDYCAGNFLSAGRCGAACQRPVTQRAARAWLNAGRLSLKRQPLNLR